MTVKVIQVFEKQPSLLAADVAYLFVTNDSGSGKGVASGQSSCGGPFGMTLMVDNYSDVYSVISNWLYALDFKNEDIKVAIYSDCRTVNATDVAYIGHVFLPNVPLESSEGSKIDGFLKKNDLSAGNWVHHSPALFTKPASMEDCNA